MRWFAVVDWWDILFSKILGALKIFYFFVESVEKNCDISMATNFWILLPVVTSIAFVWLHFQNGIDDDPTSGSQEFEDELEYSDIPVLVTLNPEVEETQSSTSSHSN